eukprot:CAMPEP_0113953642 /NCGR_PEP_ID=MMETSP1339-20121228/91084_1 /TAXON_ID=94617 /ORGANISM="Fibrocapsa japonica" /LENGTH=375 /DNA_ID=CAMNT_0000962383 /DNA_START=69 /DNA_END=1196 /DNA_ORIENTATION=- /assembly_acc=CAM_ASM_000762
MELRLQKKLMEQQLAVLNMNEAKVSNVLEKKRAKKLREKRGVAGGGNSWGNADGLAGQRSVSATQLELGVGGNSFGGTGRSLGGTGPMGGMRDVSPIDGRHQMGGSQTRDQHNEVHGHHPHHHHHQVDHHRIAPRTIKPGSDADRVRKKFLLRQAGQTLKREERERRPGPRPPKAGAYRRANEQGEILFPIRYKRGELPCSIEHKSSGYALLWICPLQTLDYEHYLPMFFEGIRCTEDPYKYMASQGVMELLDASKGYPERILPTLPEVVKYLRMALMSKLPDIIITALRCIQSLVLCNVGIGEAMVPYYRQLLSVFNLFRGKRRNLGDGMDYGQRKGDDINSVIDETLEVLERTGGEDSFANIKYMVPTYESCL